MATAATAQYLIESIGDRVDLCESQGDQWITIRQGVQIEDARRYGFNDDSPAVRAVFATVNATRA